MDANEEYVKSKWTNIGVYSYGGSTFYVNLPDAPKECFGVLEAGAWEAAAKFTRQHEEKIRLVEEEMHLLAGWRHTQEFNPPALRIAAREAAALHQLKKGMK